MLHDDLLHHRQAQAGAVGFGGVEGAEKFAAGLRGNARAIVEDGDALEAGILIAQGFAAKENSSAMSGGGAGFGGVAREIEQSLAQEAFVAGNCFEGAFAADADGGKRFGNFGDDAIDKRLQGDFFVGDVEWARVLEKFGDDMGDVLRLLEDFLGVLGGFFDGGFGANHLGVAGNGGERVFEFVGDAGGEFAESGEIFFELKMLLESGELGEVHHEADGAVDFANAAADGGNGDAEVARVAARCGVGDLFAAEDFSFGEAFAEEAGEVGGFAEGFAVAAEAESAECPARVRRRDWRWR